MHGNQSLQAIDGRTDDSMNASVESEFVSLLDESHQSND